MGTEKVFSSSTQGMQKMWQQMMSEGKQLWSTSLPLKKAFQLRNQ